MRAHQEQRTMLKKCSLNALLNSFSSVCSDNNFSFEYQNSTVWQALSDIEKRKLIIESKRYLLHFSPVINDSVITSTSTLALLLLEQTAPNEFKSLSNNIIEKHSIELFSWLECNKNQHELSLLLQAIVNYFPNVFTKNLILWLDNSMHKGCFPNLARIKNFLTSDILNDIIEHISHMRLSDKMEFLVLNEIKNHSLEVVRKYVEQRLSNYTNDISCFGHRFSVFVLDYCPEKIVDFVQKLQDNPSWGKEWFEDVIHINVCQYPLIPVFSRASIDALADLYIWLHHNYPVENEPKHVGAFTPDTYDMIYRFILEVFNSIVSYPSNTELTIQRIAYNFPDDLWLHDWIKRAKRKDLYRNAALYSEEEVLQLLTNTKSLVINSAQDLLSIVIGALHSYQTYLTGTITPRVEDLWNCISDTQFIHKREEDFSDHIKSYLDLYFKTMKIIVNREVQLNRGRNGEAGSRTDIWIDTFTTSNHQKISLCIEVKGSWNQYAKTAMRDQLIAKYMENDGADAGILLIGWFQSIKCPQKGNIWNDDRDKTREEILKQEQQARKEGLTIKGIIIDCDYRI